MSTLEVGFAKTDITPRKKRQTIYHSPGQVVDEKTPIRDPLYARATAFRVGEQAAVWVTADLLCVDSRLRSGVVEKLAPDGISSEQVVLCATHTHTSPSIIHFHGREPTPKDYLAFLEAAIVRVVRATLQSARPATVAFGKATVDLSVNRREIGRMAKINDPNSPTGFVDNSVTVARIQLSEENGNGLLLNYGAHPLAMSTNTPQISADFPGRAVAFLEQRDTVVFAQFLQGCSGNVNVKIHGDVAEANTVGAKLADAAMEAAGSARPSQSGGLRMATEVVRIPWGHIATLEEARERSTAHARDRRVVEWAERVRRAYEEGLVSPHAEVIVQAMRLGDAVFVALPGEVFVEIGMAIKQQAAAEHVFVVAYSNNCEIGYIPTSAAFSEGGYEVDSAPYYYGLFQLSPECEQIMVDAALRAVQNVL